MENKIEKLWYQRAKLRLNDLKSFYIMITGYFFMVPFWIFINIKTTPDFNWFWFPTIGCGISIMAYAIYLFSAKKWEETKIKELMEKDSISQNLKR